VAFLPGRSFPFFPPLKSQALFWLFRVGFSFHDGGVSLGSLSSEQGVPPPTHLHTAAEEQRVPLLHSGSLFSFSTSFSFFWRFSACGTVPPHRGAEDERLRTTIYCFSQGDLLVFFFLRFFFTHHCVIHVPKACLPRRVEFSPILPTPAGLFFVYSVFFPPRGESGGRSALSLAMALSPLF